VKTLLLSLTVAALCLAQEKPPEGSAPKPFKLPPAETFKLANGLQVTLIPYGTVPKVTISLRVRAGNYLEGPNQVWLADLTGELLNEGTTARTAQQMAQAAASMGGQVSVNVSTENTSVATDVLSEFGPDAVRLLASVVENPALPESELARLKTDLLRRLAITKSQPRSLAMERFSAILYPDQAYGRIFPTPEMLNAYTVEDVRGFFTKNFGAQRAHLYAAGRFDAKAMREAITAAFSTWTKGSPPDLTTAKANATPKAELIDRPGASQSVVYLGLPVAGPTDPDNIALQVTDSILGGAFGSRITSNIREQKGYTYSPFSQVSQHYHDAYWVERADITTAVTGPALDEIYKEINRLRKEAPPDEELKGIANNMAGIFVLRNSSRQGVIGQVATVDFQGLPADYLTKYIPNVLAVKPSDVQRIAEKYLSPDKMTLVIVGDKKKIEDQVRSRLSTSPDSK
jgi:predicted Zn-dependent peptidase